MLSLNGQPRQSNVRVRSGWSSLPNLASFFVLIGVRRELYLRGNGKSVHNGWRSTSSTAPKSDDDPTLKIILDYKQSQMESILNWTEFCLQGLSI